MCSFVRSLSSYFYLYADWPITLTLLPPHPPPHRYIPACLHAYALTRGGARKLVAHWDVCSNDAIDGQLRDLSSVKEGGGEGSAAAFFTWDKAADTTFLPHLRPGFEDNPDYFTRGIFVQKNGLVSFNHHGYQNNAG